MMGAVFSNITCRLIVAQMSNTEAPVFNILLIPLTILVVAIWLPNGKVRAWICASDVRGCARASVWLRAFATVQCTVCMHSCDVLNYYSRTRNPNYSLP